MQIINTYNPERIAKKLKVLRGKEKTQEEIAHALDISRSAYGMYEQGYRVPEDDTKVKIANYYGVTVQEIFFSD